MQYPGGLFYNGRQSLRGCSSVGRAARCQRAGRRFKPVHPLQLFPAGTQRWVTEWFRLSEDRTRLLIDFRVEDPEYLAETFTGTGAWVYMPELEPIGIGCGPEVSRRAWGH